MNLRKLIKKNLRRFIGIIILTSAIIAFAYSTYHFALFHPKYFWVGIEIALFITGLYLLARPRQNGKNLLTNAPILINQKKIGENITLNRVNTRNILEGVTLVLLLGLTTIGFYAFHSCFDTAFALFTLLAITGGAAFLAGSFIGFLFGIPRYNSQPPVQVVSISSDSSQMPSGNTSTHHTANTSRSLSEANRRNKILYDANTNLEQVSDWLTKILLGAGLTQVKDLPQYLRSISSYIFANVACPQAGQPFVAMVIIYFSIGGFFFGYLLTVLNLGYFLKVSAGLQEEIAEKEQEIAEKDQQLSATLNSLVNVPDIGGGRKVEAIKEAVEKQATEPIANFTDDPQKGKWGGKSENNGYYLTAYVKQLTPDIGPLYALFSIKIQVSTSEAKPTFEGSTVQFYLHPSFHPDIRSVSVQNNEAILELRGWGAFTVGAETEDGTQLELDLSQLPDAPDLFKIR